MGSLTSPKTVLIVTGAWHVPEHYSKITTRLASQGIRVLCPCLPTNNNAYPPNKFLEDDVAFIKATVATEVSAGTRLTILAHSWGGIVASAALTEFALRPDQKGGGVVDIIYMAAFIPFENQSLAGIFGGELPPYLHRHEDDTLRWDDPIGHLYNDLPAEEAAAMEELRVWHSSRTQHTGVECEKAAWRVVPVSYLFCERDNALPVGVQEMMVEKIRGEGVVVTEFRVQGGHSAFASVPDEVVGVVREVMGL